MAVTRTLADWLAWMEGNHPRQIELGLARVGRVADHLGLPLTREARRIDASPAGTAAPLVFTVGGTNGKGSCTAILEAILRAGGKRVGTYTSPHLLRYNERVRIDGVEASDADLCRAFEAIHAAQGDTSLTYFEFGTLAALWLFREAALDAWVLEVGLGGRLDAVNLVDGDAAAVISVDIDHQEWLGDDRETIGGEKGGIYRAGRPAICGDPQPPASLAAAARERGAQWLAVGEGYHFTADSHGWSWWAPGLAHGPRFDSLPLPSLPLPSAAAALALLAAVPALALADDAVRRGLRDAALPGRCQQLRVGGVDVVLDVGHNPHAARWLRERLVAAPQPSRAVFAVMADKAWPTIVSTLTDQFDGWYVGDLPETPRAAPASEIAAALRAQGAEVTQLPTLAEAWRRALAEADPGSRVVVFGSFFTVAAVLAELSSR